MSCLVIDDNLVVLARECECLHLYILCLNHISPKVSTSTWDENVNQASNFLKNSDIFYSTFYTHYKKQASFFTFFFKISQIFLKITQNFPKIPLKFSSKCGSDLLKISPQGTMLADVACDLPGPLCPQNYYTALKHTSFGPLLDIGLFVGYKGCSLISLSDKPLLGDGSLKLQTSKFLLNFN